MRAQRFGIFLLISWTLVIDARNAILRGFLLLAVFRHPSRCRNCRRHSTGFEFRLRFHPNSLFLLSRFCQLIKHVTARFNPLLAVWMDFSQCRISVGTIWHKIHSFVASQGKSFRISPWKVDERSRTIDPRQQPGAKPPSVRLKINIRPTRPAHFENALNSIKCSST